MGTPDFAVPVLKAIFEAGFNVVGVVTAADKPSGRGRKLTPSPVKQFALENGLKLFQPLKLKDAGFIDGLKKVKPDLQIVVAFRMLPKEVWSIPKKGTFNLHASMLPQYRGAAPINHAIINGEKKTGLTTFFIDEKIDTGKILEQVEMDIADDETFGGLHDKMMLTGAELVLSTIDKITGLKPNVIDQSSLVKKEKVLNGAPKISKGFCRINWNSPVNEIYDFIRGLSPYPAAYTFLANQNKELITVKVFKVVKIMESHSFESGKIITDNKTYLKVAVADGLIGIDELQVMGKRRMSTGELLNGFKLSEGAKLVFFEK